MFADRVGCCRCVDCYWYGQMILNKLPDTRNDFIKLLHKNGFSYREIAPVFNLSKSMVGQIVTGKFFQPSKEQNKLRYLRQQARLEARETNVPIDVVYKKYGVSYKKHMDKSHDNRLYDRRG